jgi:alpha-methylacyl-CoA racemase
MGADVIVIDRPKAMPNMMDSRGKKSMVLDLRKPEAVEAVLSLVETADILIEGYRPGVTERLGLGPEPCLKRNPKLVYGRMTGWGQDGPYSQMAGHDINYLSLTGFLHMTGKQGQAPNPPLNLVGDYGGGALFLAVGVISALFNAQRTGQGDVVDAAIIDGVSSMMGIFQSLKSMGQWSDQREDNLLDGGAPFYRCYETSDCEYMAVGCIEPKFFALMLEGLTLTAQDYGDQYDKAAWPQQRVKLGAVFKTKSRDEWAKIFGGTDACVTPVLSLKEAQGHPHNQARKSHDVSAGIFHPHPAPRFSDSAQNQPPALPVKGADTADILRSIGLSEDDIAGLV